jgi:uncharacterized phage infection (PIP) family protein YhgE
MEKVKSDSLKLQNILSTVETAVQEYISSVTQMKTEHQTKAQRQIEELNNEIDRLKIEIECNEAAISFIKSSLSNRNRNKENLENPKKTLHSKVAKYRELAEKYSQDLRNYEKKLGLSMKKLGDNTLWVSFHYITQNNQGEHSVVIKVESGAYHLINCTPNLEEIDEIIQELNNANDFSKFLKSLRAAFKDLYKNTQ